MDPITTPLTPKEVHSEKLFINIANLPKMLSAWFITVVGLAWTAYTSLPDVCSPEAANCLSQAAVLGAIRPLFAWVPPPLLALATTILGLYLRVKPQWSITPGMAAAKSEAAPQPSIAQVAREKTTADRVADHFETGPAPLPSIPPHDDTRA